jgi:hypothetical protein
MGPFKDSDVLPDDELFRAERMIAQRADALARSLGADANRSALDCWQQAEREFWEGALADASTTKSCQQ